MSDLDGRLEITWPNTVTLAKLADEMEFEALVPVARWRGFGGATDPQGPGFETYTWAAGIAGATRNAGVVSTSHVALNHPIIAAKQSAVIDHISNGRYTLNVVNGWNFPEMEMFGVSLLEHEDRYACAEEWLTIVKRLWTRGRAFRPRRQVLPDQGRLPAAEADPVALSGDHERRLIGARPAFRLQALRSRLHQYPHPRYRRPISPMSRPITGWRARTYGREIRVWANANIVQAETEKEARDFYNYYVHEKGDWVAARNVIDTMGAEINKRDYPEERRNAMAEMMISGWGGFPADRHQGADRRRPRHAFENRPRRRALVMAALYRGHARIPRRDLSAAQAGRAAGLAMILRTEAIQNRKLLLRHWTPRNDGHERSSEG